MISICRNSVTVSVHDNYALKMLPFRVHKFVHVLDFGCWYGDWIRECAKKEKVPMCTTMESRVVSMHACKLLPLCGGGGGLSGLPRMTNSQVFALSHHHIPPPFAHS